MNLTPMEWKSPQICGDCREMASEGWQELKYSAGGPYIEKRCNPCANRHYGETELDQLVKPTTKRTAGRKATDQTVIGNIYENPELLQDGRNQ